MRLPPPPPGEGLRDLAEFPPDDDPLRAARGVWNAVVLSVLFVWLPLMVWWVTR